jgi:flagellar basal body P-ring protein FlgI
MPDKEIAFTLKKENFAKVQKAATTLNLPDIAIKGDGKSIIICCYR